MKIGVPYGLKETIRPIQPWWAYIESTILLAIVVGINRFGFPDKPAFKGLPFSLLWLPIILISSRYGTAPAVFVSVICGGYYFMSVSLENFFYGKFEFAFEDKVTLFVFLAVGVFLGQMYDRFHSRLGKLLHEHQTVKRQLENLRLHLRSLETANQKLEKRIVSRYTTLNSLYEMARYLESLSEQHLFRGIIELVRRFLQADRICVYILEGGEGIRLAESLGYSEADSGNLVARVSRNPLIRAAFEGDHVLSFRDGFEDQARKKEGFEVLLAAPIRLLHSRRTIGVLTVDRLPFLALNSGNIRILGMIADWAARALEKSKTFSNLSSREPLFDKTSGVYSQAYFEVRIVQEISRAMRYRLPLSLLTLRINGWDAVKPENQPDLLAIVARVVVHAKRDLDIPCRYPIPSVIGIILPLTDGAGAKILLERLRTMLEIHAFPEFPPDIDRDVTLILHTFHGGQVGQSDGARPEAVAREFLEAVETRIGKDPGMGKH